MMIRKDVGKLSGLPGSEISLWETALLCGCQILDRVDRLWRSELPRLRRGDVVTCNLGGVGASRTIGAS